LAGSAAIRLCTDPRHVSSRQAGCLPHCLIDPFGLVCGQADQPSLFLWAEPQRQRPLPVGQLQLLTQRLLAVLGGSQPLRQLPPGGQLGSQPGLAAFLYSGVARPGGHLAEQLCDQAGPQVGFGVVPGVEVDLPDRWMSEAVIGAIPRHRSKLARVISQAAQEVGLAFPQSPNSQIANGGRAD